jgi:hypothetical protein
MQTTTDRKPRQAKTRKIGVVERHGKHSLLEIVESTSKTAKAEYYLCEEFTPGWGDAAYRLEKFDGTQYDVLIDDQSGHHACDCPGHVQHGHRTRCKHLAGILALRAAGKLPVAPKPAAPLASHPRLQEVGDHYRTGYHDEPLEDIFAR